MTPSPSTCIVITKNLGDRRGQESQNHPPVENYQLRVKHAEMCMCPSILYRPGPGHGLPSGLTSHLSPMGHKEAGLLLLFLCCRKRHTFTANYFWYQLQLLNKLFLYFLLKWGFLFYLEKTNVSTSLSMQLISFGNPTYPETWSFFNCDKMHIYIVLGSIKCKSGSDS